MEHLIKIQGELKAPKDKWNPFGKYHYRSCEGILEAVKPLCHKHGCLLVISDEIVNIGERYYVKAIATLRTPDGVIEATAYAREEDVKKGMDGSQITGTASSYARKYALNGLFNIDDVKDSDAEEHHNESKAKKEKAEKPKSQATKKSKDALMDELVALCDKKRFRVSDFCNKTGVSSLDDMDEEQLQKWIDWVNSK